MRQYRTDLNHDVNMEPNNNNVPANYQHNHYMDEIIMMPDFNKQTFYTELNKYLFKEFKDRYDLIGGRIRQLLNPSISYSILKNDLDKSVSAVSLELLSQVGSFEKNTFVPSVLYSLVPQDYMALSPYKVNFASPFIANEVFKHVILQKRGGLQEFFAALKNENTANSLLAIMFEKIVHQLFTQQRGQLFSFKKLNQNDDDNENNTNQDFSFNQPLGASCYNHTLTNLHNLLFLSHAHYLIPNALNAPCTIWAMDLDLHFFKLLSVKVIL